MTKHAPATPMRNLDRIRELHALPHLDVAQRLEHCERDRAQLVAKAQALLALLRATAPTADARTKAMGDMGALLRSLGEE